MAFFQLFSRLPISPLNPPGRLTDYFSITEEFKIWVTVFYSILYLFHQESDVPVNMYFSHSIKQIFYTKMICTNWIGPVLYERSAQNISYCDCCYPYTPLPANRLPVNDRTKSSKTEELLTLLPTMTDRSWMFNHINIYDRFLFTARSFLIVCICLVQAHILMLNNNIKYHCLLPKHMNYSSRI